MNLFVCGGREYRDRASLYAKRDALHLRMTALMCGGARGADNLAYDRDLSRKFHCERSFLISHP
ncbi:SLOG family protein [Ensifer soli]|uniref:SLOG family protein n=1 Tax=Ciceribacter sp. sgz301302 TaxID=3342379 RepID=UPI0035BB45BE